MAPVTALIYLLPLLATLADATPINRRIGRRNANKVCPNNTSGATTTDKPQWADYAAHSGGDDKYAKHPPVAIGNGQRYPDIDGGKYPDEDDEVDDDVVSSTSESAPTPTSAQQQAPTSSPPTPSPSPTEAEPEPALEPSSEPPTPAPSDDSQSTTYPVGSVIPVPHPNLKPQPNYPTNNDPQGWMEAHNMIRAQFGVGTVGWSEGAYAQAKANVEGHAANGCKMEHTKDGKFGENLFWMSDGNGNKGPDQAMPGWAGEAKNFNWTDPNHQTADLGAWGHFTPIVWRDLTEIGCATAGCPGGESIVACCYNGGVNMGGWYDRMVPQPL